MNSLTFLLSYDSSFLWKTKNHNMKITFHAVLFLCLVTIFTGNLYAGLFRFMPVFFAFYKN